MIFLKLWKKIIYKAIASIKKNMRKRGKKEEKTMNLSVLLQQIFKIC